MNSSPGTQRKKFARFEKKDKLRLIAAVKIRRLLWDMTDNEHSDIVGVKSAWQAVSAEVDRSPHECKVAWRSLRQSYRYHSKAAHSRFKIDCDSNDDDADPLETPDIQWEFAQHMSFLQDISRKIRRADSENMEAPLIIDSMEEAYTDTEYLETAYNTNDADADSHVNNSAVDTVDDESTSIIYVTNAFKRKPLESTINGLCRTCGRAIDFRTAQNLFKPENYRLVRQIKILTDLNLKRDEDLSDLICGNCQQNLNIATEFRRVCIDAQTQALTEIQVKRESEIKRYADSPNSEDISIEEERLEGIEILYSADYYEEKFDVQPLPPTSPLPEAKVKLNKKSEAVKFQCHECGMTFTSQDLLKMHMHQLHDVQLHTRFVCKHCGYDFKYSAPLVEHLKSIGIKFSYKCEECEQKFHSRHFLKKHMRRVHGQSDEHICHICGKNFTTGFNLRNHIVRHAGTRPHKCKLCSAAFSTTAELNNHKRTHDNIRPYPCRYGCGKYFRHCSNRSTHERVHMDGSLRPYQCEYCHKSFVTQGDCRAHQMVHTMSRDYSCDICAQSFKLQKHYQQHLTTKSHKKLETLAR